MEERKKKTKFLDRSKKEASEFSSPHQTYSSTYREDTYSFVFFMYFRWYIYMKFLLKNIYIFNFLSRSGSSSSSSSRPRFPKSMVDNLFLRAFSSDVLFQGARSKRRIKIQFKSRHYSREPCMISAGQIYLGLQREDAKYLFQLTNSRLGVTRKNCIYCMVRSNVASSRQVKNFSNAGKKNVQVNQVVFWQLRIGIRVSLSCRSATIFPLSFSHGISTIQI